MLGENDDEEIDDVDVDVRGDDDEDDEDEEEDDEAIDDGELLASCFLFLSDFPLLCFFDNSMLVSLPTWLSWPWLCVAGDTALRYGDIRDDEDDDEDEDVFESCCIVCESALLAAAAAAAAAIAAALSRSHLKRFCLLR